MAWQPAVALLGLALLLAACDGGGERRTGIGVVDTVIEAVEAGDVEAIVSMMEFSKAPCYAFPRPEGEMPLPENSFIECEVGESDQELVAAFPKLLCSGRHMVRANHGRTDLRSTLESVDPGVYGVYEPRNPLSPVTTEASDQIRYAMMLTYDFEDRKAGLALLLSDVGLVGTQMGCPFSPDQMAEGFGEAILPPLPTGDDLPETSD